MKRRAEHKEPFVRMAKRASIAPATAWMIRGAALLGALLMGALLLLILGHEPLRIYREMARGAFGGAMYLKETARTAVPLLISAIGIAFAFKMQFWNIGAEGQILIGGLVSAALMININTSIPNVLLLILMFAGSALGGMIWGLIPTIFKAKWKTNETLFTLMLNYVAMQIVTFCIVFWENPKGSNTVGIINQQTRAGWLPKTFGSEYFWNIVIVAAFTVLMFIYLKYSKRGYEVAVVGESERTARYAGISVKKVLLRTMAVSGAICGVAGFILVSGSGHTISTSTAGGRGFTAIIVAWLSRFNTFVMVLVAFGIVFMEKGAIQIASQYGLNENASDVLLGIILFFIIGAEFFTKYKVERNHK